MDRILVSLPENIMKLVDKQKGTMGEGRSDVIRFIVTSYFSEKGYLKNESDNSDTKSKTK